MDNLTYTYNGNQPDSVRVVNNDNGNAEQVNNYYPFGGEFTAISTSTELQPWKYTGKEYNHRHGLDLYDFGARMYDPAVLLWTSVDSRAENYYDIGPYAFCKNNPVNAIDPDGRNVVLIYYDNSNQQRTLTINGPGIYHHSKNQFACDFFKAYNYNIGNGGGKFMKLAVNDPIHT